MNSNFWDRFIIEGTEDEVGLWQIVRQVEEGYPQIEVDELQFMTLQLIREILERGFMAIGMFEYNDNNKLEFKIWEVDIDSIINRLEAEWNELGRVPNIGDIAWLITTEKGEKEAENILKSKKEDENQRL